MASINASLHGLAARRPVVSTGRLAGLGAASDVHHDLPVRESRQLRVARTTFNVVGLAAIVGATLAAVTLWLLLTDPVTASEVLERGDLLPAFRSVVISVGKAITAVIRFL